MTYTVAEIQERIAPVAKKYDLASVCLFGSYARGNAREDSDIDLLIDIRGSKAIGLEFGALANDLESGLGKGVDLITTSLFEKAKEARPSRLRLMTSVLRERISLYEQ
ncbi:MAG: nucleotidyltransferase domain-containing protein [Coriobacteriia bacterium]|nr:nucleotidyltransferase domain-containing protein [Coriobacteriia bacterium]